MFDNLWVEFVALRNELQHDDHLVPLHTMVSVEPDGGLDGDMY